MNALDAAVAIGSAPPGTGSIPMGREEVRRTHGYLFGAPPIRGLDVAVEYRDTLEPPDDPSAQRARCIAGQLPKKIKVEESNIVHVLGTRPRLHTEVCKLRHLRKITSAKGRAAHEQSLVSKFRRCGLTISFRLVREVIGSFRIYPNESQETNQTEYIRPYGLISSFYSLF